jgi:hypothetical protein
MKYRTLAFILLLIPPGIHAENPVKQVLTKADTLLQKIYYAGGYDTTYIRHSEGKMGVKLWGNASGSSLRANGPNMKATLKTDNKTTLSAEFDYYDLSLEMALPISLNGKNDDLELNFNLYGRRYNINACYQNAKSAAGTITYDGTTTDIEKGWLHTNILNLSFYYTFNHRHFSYDAPFCQLFVQKHSAGSWLAGLSFQSGSIKTTSNIPANIPESYFRAQHIGIGGGYAYNLVATKRWLLHFSVIPNVIVWKGNKIRMNGEQVHDNMKSPTILVDAKVASVYYLSPRHFMGFNGLINGLMKRKSKTEIIEDKWFFRLFYGVRI